MSKLDLAVGFDQTRLFLLGIIMCAGGSFCILVRVAVQVVLFLEETVLEI